MTLTREEQAALATRVKEGDRQAFERLYSVIRKPVYGFLKVHANNQSDAEDIDQELWTKLWEKKLATYDPVCASCLTYIRAIAWTTLLDYYGRKPQEVLLPIHPEEELNLEDLLARLSPSHPRRLPEAMRRLYEDAALRLTFEGSSPPHQLIVFGFVERLGWNPREVIAELSDVQLRKLAETLETEYIATSELSVDLIRRRFKRLRDYMPQLVGDVVTEPKTREVCRTFLDLFIGNTALRQYYTQEANEISHWCQAVRRRAATEAARQPHPKNIPAIACEKKAT